MADNLHRKESMMKPVLEESFSGDGTIVGVFPAGEINPIDDSFSGDDGIVRIFPAAGINVPIDQDDSSSRDDGIIATYPTGINPIPMENSSSMDDEGIVGVFAAAGVNIPITMEDSSSRDDGNVGVFPAPGINPIDQDDSFSRDDGIIAVFPAGGTEEGNCVPDYSSATGNKAAIIIIPGRIGSDGEVEENPVSDQEEYPSTIGNEYSSSEESSASSPADETIVTEPVSLDYFLFHNNFLVTILNLIKLNINNLHIQLV